MSDQIRRFCHSWAVDVGRYHPVDVPNRSVAEPSVSLPASLKRKRPSNTQEPKLEIASSRLGVQDQSSKPALRRSQRRRPLDKSNNNITRMPRPAKAPGKAAQTPSAGTAAKKRRLDPDTPRKEIGVAAGIVTDNEETPRAIATSEHLQFPIRALERPTLVATFSGSNSSVPSSQRSRSRSPQKATLQRGIDPFEFKKMLIGKRSTFPAAFRKMVDQMEKYKDGYGVLPKDVQAPMLAYEDLQSSIATVYKRPQFYDRSGDREKLGQPLTAEQAQEIVTKSNRCGERLLPEVAWNARVHDPLLDKSLSSCSYSNVVNVEFLTTATIQPPDLCPRVYNNLSTSRKVDLGIFLELPQRVVDHIFQEQRILSLNQTFHEPVRYTPLAVSIETKLAGQDYASAQTQLAVWAFAQFQHLYRVCGHVPPFLPLLVVQGDEWSFLGATAHDWPPPGEKPAPDQKFKTVIWEKVVIGSTDYLEGVWRVSAAIQYLACWAATDYMEWLREHIPVPKELWEESPPAASGSTLDSEEDE